MGNEENVRLLEEQFKQYRSQASQYTPLIDNIIHSEENIRLLEEQFKQYRSQASDYGLIKTQPGTELDYRCAKLTRFLFPWE